MSDLRLPPGSLLSAALLGLLSTSLVACSGETTQGDDDNVGGGSNAGRGTTATGGDSTQDSAGPGGAGGQMPASYDPPDLDCIYSAMGGESAGSYVVCNEKSVASVTLSEFTEECDTYQGTVEVHPSCGGFNSCAGISYDERIGVRSEHSCAGLNTCAGFTCVFPKTQP